MIPPGGRIGPNRRSLDRPRSSVRRGYDPARDGTDPSAPLPCRIAFDGTAPGADLAGVDQVAD